ncbi:MAG: DUF4115 domain-containing protein [Chloroflexi bacterium]|nr:DUF4115 domain-containing protein [Chloroflexota bacterium]
MRETREAQRLSLLDVERETRIRHIYLQALEEERFDDLPGDVYARGFIRNYALSLGLDPQPLLEEYDHIREAPQQDETAVLNEPLLPQRINNTGARVFLILMALLVILLVGWYAYNRFYGGVSPSDLLSRLGIKVHQTSTPTLEPGRSGELDTPSPTEFYTLAPTITATPEVTASPARTAFPTRTPTAISGILIVADVLEDTWVHAIADGEVIFDGALTAGDQRTWQAASIISLSIGNAGGISLTVNNVPVGVLGASGELIDMDYTLDTLPTPAP